MSSCLPINLFQSTPPPPVSVFDYLSPAERQDVIKGTCTLDVTKSIQKAINEVVPKSKWLLLPAGTYRLDGTLLLPSKTLLTGAGATKTILKKFSTGHLINCITPVTKSKLQIQDLTFDSNLVDTGLAMAYIQDSIVRRCIFKNHPYWGISLGIPDSTQKTIVNRRVTIDSCQFINTTKTYEHLLIFNSYNITVTNCSFSQAPNATGIGLWQNCQQITISYCRFMSMIRGIYYSLSTNNINIKSCFFSDNYTAIRGANTSDNGDFGFTQVVGLNILNCTFTKSHGPCLCLGGVYQTTVIGSNFVDNDQESIHISPDQHLLLRPSKNISIQKCNFQNNNNDGIGPNGAGIKVESGSLTGLNIVACTWLDTRDTPRQTVPIVFKHMYFYDWIVIKDCVCNSYLGNPSVALIEGATLGTNVSIVNSKGDFRNLPVKPTFYLRVKDELRRRFHLFVNPSRVEKSSFYH